MIVQQLSQILENGDESEELDRLVDEFRENREATELIDLLNSTSDEFIRVGVWILSEIRPAKYDNRLFVDRLQELTSHSSPAIRFYSLNALFPFLEPENSRTVNLIARMRNDENEGVRKAADAAALRLGMTI